MFYPLIFLFVWLWNCDAEYKWTDTYFSFICVLFLEYLAAKTLMERELNKILQK